MKTLLKENKAIHEQNIYYMETKQHNTYQRTENHTGNNNEEESNENDTKTFTQNRGKENDKPPNKKAF